MRRISTREVVRDIREGISDTELMGKYRISDRRLKKLMKRLVQKRAIPHAELYGRSPLYKGLFDRLRERNHPRIDILVPLKIQEIGTPNSGLVRDISETGLRVAGLRTAVGEVKTFQLTIDIIRGFDPLIFIARCVWVETKGKNRQYETAGFEIVDISDSDRPALRKFLQMLLVSKSGEWKLMK